MKLKNDCTCRLKTKSRKMQDSMAKNIVRKRGQKLGCFFSQTKKTGALTYKHTAARSIEL